MPKRGRRNRTRKPRPTKGAHRPAIARADRRPSDQRVLSLHRTGLEDAIAEAAPEFVSAAEKVAQQLRHYLDIVYTGEAGAPESFSTIFSQATNDFLDALAAVTAGHGRPAMRGARSVFESAITLLDVVGDAEADHRYMKHLWVTAFLEASISFGEDLMSDGDKEREEARRMRYMASAKTAYEELMGDPKYGRRFRNNWASKDLAARAKAHGQMDMYLLYKFASGITHSAVGGGYGIETLVLGRQVVRTGPALAICPIAALYAIRSLRLVVPLDFRSQEHPYTVSLVEALEAAEAAWPAFRQAILELDARIWPREPPPQGFETVLAVSAAGVVRWFIGDPRKKVLALITAPQQVPQVVQSLIAAVRQDSDIKDAEAFFILDGVVPSMPPGPEWLPFESLSSAELMLRVQLP